VTRSITAHAPPMFWDEMTETSDPRPFAVLATSMAFAPGFRAGGPIRSVTHLLDTLPRSVAVDLITRDRDHGSTEAFPGLGGTWQPYGRSAVFYLNLRSLTQWHHLMRRLHRQTYDVLYLNSLWSPAFSLLFLFAFTVKAVRARLLVIAPRGECSPGALAQKSTKKRVLLSVLRRALRRRDVLWHATSELEETEIRRAVPGAKTVVNGNQSSLPASPRPPLVEPSDEVRLVFLSRISPKKNLKLALAALSHVTRPVALDVYGPLEDSAYWEACLAEVRQSPAHITVRYRGTVSPDKVQATFGAYDAFLFPTMGENFGHVILESLSSSCPVILSDRTPWTDVLRSGGGYVFERMSVEELGAVLESFCALDRAERAAARARAGEAYRRYRESVRDQPHLFDQIRSISAEFVVEGGRPRGRGRG
jgi:glycosyltransferase involved in cell wall biosynthesis